MSLLERSNVAFTTSGLSGRLDMVEPTSENDIFAFLEEQCNEQQASGPVSETLVGADCAMTLSGTSVTFQSRIRVHSNRSAVEDAPISRLDLGSNLAITRAYEVDCGKSGKSRQ